MKRCLMLLPLLFAGCARKQVAVAPRVPHRHVLNAVDAGDGDYELKVLRAKLEANVNDVAARIALAARYQRLGFSDVALEHLRLACERHPDSLEANLALARLWRDQGNPLEGARQLDRFAQKTTTVWAWIGLLNDAAGEYKTGEAAYRKALALAPDRDDLHNNLGYCLLAQGKKSDAAAEFQAALRMNPESVIARNNLAGVQSGEKTMEARGDSRRSYLAWVWHRILGS